ncbi:PTS system mannose/fructose/sorbose family IID component [Klebsiella michiganensis]|nr:PTS system mannose/fructose/sorbose family IID component [Klebsiella michiganensis]
MNENVYEDQNISADLTKKDINRVAWRSMLLQLLLTMSVCRHLVGYTGLLPALKKIHTNKRDLPEP